MKALLTGWNDYILPAGIVAGGILAGFILYGIFVKIVDYFVKKSGGGIAALVVKRYRSPLRLLFPITAVYIVLPFVSFTTQFLLVFHHILDILLIIAAAWLAAKMTYVMDDYISLRYSPDNMSDFEARKVRTQVHFFKRLAIVAIIVIAASVVLMTFDSVRQLGTTILASAGVAGVILGFAAQNTLGTLFAGLQIAITQPIRIDDVVIVEGEWGRIEEITLTYVVVKIWDLRRLVVPIKYFIDNPIQNWTRTSKDLLGTVYLYMDYQVPVDAVREELKRILGTSENWDGKVQGVQVTDLKERTVEVRALMSSGDSSALWNLRCEVREKLLEFIRKEYPGSLPRVRAQMYGVLRDVSATNGGKPDQP